MENAGIDYSNGQANINLKTGIRYGVISMHNVDDDFLAEFTTQYSELPSDGHSEDCSYHADSEDCDCPIAEELEPISFTHKKDDIHAEYTSDNSMNVLFVYESKTIVECKFCSPCCPGAGDLDNIVKDGIKTYGLPADCLYQEE